MNVWHLVGPLLVALVSPVYAQVPCRGTATVVSVDTASFLLKAPRGWIFDCEAGKSQGPLTVLYRVAEGWRSGSAVMYVSVLNAPSAAPGNFTARVAEEAAEWRRRAPNVQVTPLPALGTNGGRAAKATVRRFYSPTEQLFEVVAYVPRGGIIPLVAMTARSAQAFRSSLPAFRRLVESYEPATLRIVK